MATVRTALLQDRYLRREALAEGGFRYLRPDGRVYRNRDGLARIAALAVPPAYTEVYVSPDAEAALQAFGRDAAGRLQYRYHPDFVREQAMRKWRRLARFAADLPRLRERIGADLRRAGLPRQKVLALLVRLLDRVYLRVGYASYARRYRSYGLTTLRKRHVRVEGNRVVFHYRGKHGVEQEQKVRDRAIAQAVVRLLELPGSTLFQCQEGDGDGSVRAVRAEELNAYLREAMGPYTAKDFRTWGGTLKAAEFLAAEGPAPSDSAAGRVMARCVRAVAAELGNTAAVTRSSYICPVIFDLYLEGRVLDDYARTPDEETGLSRSEAALRRMLARALGVRRRPQPPSAPEPPVPPRSANALMSAGVGMSAAALHIPPTRGPGRAPAQQGGSP